MTALVCAFGSSCSPFELRTIIRLGSTLSALRGLPLNLFESAILADAPAASPRQALLRRWDGITARAMSTSHPRARRLCALRAHSHLACLSRGDGRNQQRIVLPAQLEIGKQIRAFGVTQ